MPAEPGGSAAPIFSSRPLSTLCRVNLPITPPTAPPTTVAASSGGANSPTTSPTPPPLSRPLRPRWSPVSLTATVPSASAVTSATPSTSSCSSSTSFTSASNSCWARSGIRYAAITTSNSVSLIVSLLRWRLRPDPADGIRLRGVLVEGMFIGVVQMRGYVEDYFLDCAGEREWSLVGVASIDYQAVVSTDVQARVAAETERHRVIDPTAAHWLAVDEQRDLTGRGRLRLVRRKGHLDVHISRRQLCFGLLVVFKDPQERVGVLQLPVLDEQGEASEMTRVGDDHAFGATVRDV